MLYCYYFVIIVLKTIHAIAKSLHFCHKYSMFKKNCILTQVFIIYCTGLSFLCGQLDIAILSDNISPFVHFFFFLSLSSSNGSCQTNLPDLTSVTLMIMNLLSDQ